MTDFIIAVMFLILALLVIVLRKAYLGVPLYELKRQAASGDSYASAIYPVVAYGESFRALLWLMLAITTAVSVVLFARLAPVWIGIIMVGILLWLTFSWLPNARSSKFNRQLALRLLPAFAWVMHWAFPVIKELGRLGSYYQQGHTGLYETEDLHRMLMRQELQADNRITPLKLGRVRKLLAFEEAKVAKYLTPWSEIMTLAADELISPKLLDEMHKSGQTAFPITKTKSSKLLVGVLNRDSVGLKSQGKVADYMHESVKYVKQDELMESVLAKFALSGQVLFVVVNKAEDIVGALTLKDALGSLLAPEGRNTNVGSKPLKPTDEALDTSDDKVLTGHDLETGEEINESTQ